MMTVTARSSRKLCVIFRPLSLRRLTGSPQIMGSRYAESQGAYREVQQRHADVQRIERTITELAQLFNDVRL